MELIINGYLYVLENFVRCEFDAALGGSDGEHHGYLHHPCAIRLFRYLMFLFLFTLYFLVLFFIT